MKIHTKEHCTLVGISLENPAEAVRDPALTALIGDGWRVVANMATQRGERIEWLLLMAPPEPGVENQVSEQSIRKLLARHAAVNVFGMITGFGIIQLLIMYWSA